MGNLFPDLLIHTSILMTDGVANTSLVCETA